MSIIMFLVCWAVLGFYFWIFTGFTYGNLERTVPNKNKRVIAAFILGPITLGGMVIEWFRKE